MVGGLQDRELIKDTFGRFVSRDVADAVLSGPHCRATHSWHVPTRPWRALPAGDLIAAATVRKLGKPLIFTECTFVQPSGPDIAVHATATWTFLPVAATAEAAIPRVRPGL